MNSNGVLRGSSLSESTYEVLTVLLNQNNLAVDAAELQGLLAGMLSGGMSMSDREWQNAIADMFKAGEPLTNDRHFLKSKNTCEFQLCCASMSLANRHLMMLKHRQPCINHVIN